MLAGEEFLGFFVIVKTFWLNFIMASVWASVTNVSDTQNKIDCFNRRKIIRITSTEYKHVSDESVSFLFKMNLCKYAKIPNKKSDKNSTAQRILISNLWSRFIKLSDKTPTFHTHTHHSPHLVCELNQKWSFFSLVVLNFPKTSIIFMLICIDKESQFLMNIYWWGPSHISQAHPEFAVMVNYENIKFDCKITRSILSGIFCVYAFE